MSAVELDASSQSEQGLVCAKVRLLDLSFESSTVCMTKATRSCERMIVGIYDNRTTIHPYNPNDVRELGNESQTAVTKWMASRQSEMLP